LLELRLRRAAWDEAQDYVERSESRPGTYAEIWKVYTNLLPLVREHHKKTGNLTGLFGF
jgi:hypothetical protein